jgi:hypothetical protein
MFMTPKNNLLQRLVQVLAQIWVLRPAVQRRMSKKKWSDGVDLRTLSGAEWLRLLTGETNMVALIGWCGQCRVGECYQESCSRCGEALILFDEPFWVQIGRKIRRALQTNRALLSQVKRERESLYGTKHQPTFPAPLAWLHALWEETSPPPHQPFVPKIHYQVANWIESLRQLGLSKEEIIEVLGDGELPDGLTTRTRQDYAKLPHADLLMLRKEFRRTVGSLPGSVKSLPEMWRTIKWVDRQRTAPMARLRGERVRERNSAEE